MITADLLDAVTKPAARPSMGHYYRESLDHFSAPLASAGAETEIVNRDVGLTELDNVLSGSAWDLWTHFEQVVPKASRAIIDFWNRTQGGKAVLILDGLSLRECPWLSGASRCPGYKLQQGGSRIAELPAETTPFANALGFVNGRRSKTTEPDRTTGSRVLSLSPAICLGRIASIWSVRRRGRFLAPLAGRANARAGRGRCRVCTPGERDPRGIGIG